ncbi:Pyridoxine biosynthesis glutamine amidotransferase, glutaminase subunit [Planococcus halocryophilus Or1]|uniref:Pyridoxal 5'-phosphate synthase subunit PdxT n=1 Tax=Planococcus halocryophilus TaxID=1215089 RepID=A0A1C7DTC9_9BACL|nr:pyridoxal 5'-phosphate synthase glutaminase subunit PdxT [Planococcus halocryophilus]ANU14652.1 glutamine amidotransferase subunit PdxT [Planococcus halocryophilus]EMF46695.1 Pyridoxine biosynthesis glutamine amidotransferase, glutaminase subunit [Planococcus halocryophilus Or1]
MKRVGVLALQGAVREHIKSVQACGAEAIAVKWPKDLENLDGLILPGGESTTMRRLIDRYGLMEPLREFAQTGKPMFGTCAGLILLAETVVGSNDAHLGVMDVTVERNSFGRQVDSFEAPLTIDGIDGPFEAVFIRAPHIVSVGAGIEVLCVHNGKIVMARDGQFLGCSFHPELTDDHRITAYFLSMIQDKSDLLLPNPSTYSKV